MQLKCKWPSLALRLETKRSDFPVNNYFDITDLSACSLNSFSSRLKMRSTLCVSWDNWKHCCLQSAQSITLRTLSTSAFSVFAASLVCLLVWCSYSSFCCSFMSSCSSLLSVSTSPMFYSQASWIPIFFIYFTHLFYMLKCSVFNFTTVLGSPYIELTCWNLLPSWWFWNLEAVTVRFLVDPWPVCDALTWHTKPSHLFCSVLLYHGMQSLLSKRLNT